MAEKKLVIENLESFEELKEDDFSEITGGLRLAPDYQEPDILPGDGGKPVPLPLPTPKPYPYYPCHYGPYKPRKPLPVDGHDGGVIALPWCAVVL